MKYIEYIQNGTGTGKESGWGIPLNYIPTDKNNISVRFKIDWTNLSNQDGVILFGCNQGNGNAFRLFSYRSNYLCFDCPNDSDGRINIPFTMGQETEFEAKWDNKTLSLTNLTTNETVTGTTTRTGSFTVSWYVWKESTQVSVGVKIYYIDIYEDGTIVKQYRPALDANDVPCLYEELGGTYHYNYDSNKVLTVGPVLSTINATPSKSSLANEGETISIEVECENAWTVSQLDNWLTLSETGDTGSTTITATAPSYSGATARVDTLTFTDSVTGDEVEITIRQKKYSTGQPMYLGADEISEIYLGEDEISEAYLGDVLVYSSGPFQGLKIIPSTISFNSTSLTGEVKVKSSEAWTMTVPSWISASVLTGDTGETIVTLTATAQASATADTISITTANYSASVSVNYVLYEQVSYVYATNHNAYVQANHINTGIEHTASTMTIEIEYYGLGGNSDRMVGYQQGDDICPDDASDFRVFGYNNGTFDYQYYRSSFGNSTSGYHHYTIGDCFCYDNETGLYLCQDATKGVIPTPNCHILVDVSYIKVKSVKIMDGSTVLFNGVAGKIGNDIGLYDLVSNQLFYNSNVPMSYDA